MRFISFKPDDIFTRPILSGRLGFIEQAKLFGEADLSVDH